MIVSEFVPGGSLDKLLYTERWEPALDHVLQGALGVAEGMQSMHNVLEDSSGKLVPVIHRDPKSPNLLVVKHSTRKCTVTRGLVPRRPPPPPVCKSGTKRLLRAQAVCTAPPNNLPPAPTSLGARY